MYKGQMPHLRTLNTLIQAESKRYGVCGISSWVRPYKQYSLSWNNKFIVIRLKVLQHLLKAC